MKDYEGYDCTLLSHIKMFFGSSSRGETLSKEDKPLDSFGI
jgi:hypothetical protein